MSTANNIPDLIRDLKVRFTRDESFLLACSGGVDSVVLAHIFSKCNLKFSLAHVNYNLRGSDSVQDQNLVALLAEKLAVPSFFKTTDKESLLQIDNNTQVAARVVRYQFFDELVRKNDFDFICTAHHQNDLFETFFINLFRGSGINGLVGFGNNKLFRPLLNISKEEIYSYANQQKLTWREDVSNQKIDYLRNKIRLKLQPFLETIKPGSTQNINQSINWLNQDKVLLQSLMSDKIDQISIKNSFGGIDVLAENYQLLLTEGFAFHFLNHYGFNGSQIEDLKSSIAKEKYSVTFESKFYIVSLMRNALYLDPKESLNKFCFTLNFSSEKNWLSGKLQLTKFNENLEKSPFLLPVELKKSGQYVLRNYLAADKISIKSGRKLVSDVLNEAKIPIHRRQFYPVLTLNEKVIWVLGLKKAYNIEVNIIYSDFLEYNSTF